MIGGDFDLVFVCGKKQFFFFFHFLFIIIFIVVSQMKCAHWEKIKIHERNVYVCQIIMMYISNIL